MKTSKRIVRILVVVLLAVNGVAAMHAYKFTHYDSAKSRTQKDSLTTLQKVKILLTGIDNPRPENNRLPAHPYETVYIKSNVMLECWYVPHTAGVYKGTVILFHGYTGNKSGLLDRAEVLLQQGYNCLLADFMGSGGSGGNVTTIGFKEAEEVKDCYTYLKNKGEKKLFLLGTSMGAVAIMKAIDEYGIAPTAVVIECPFGTMYETVCARFRMMHVPTIPMAPVLLFWGGFENGFGGFSHRPVQYAKSIKCPTLLQYGAHDDRVTMQETERIYANLSAPKKLVVYTDAGHDDFLKKSRKDWQYNVTTFLDNAGR
jgi:uncharacterized protein